MSAKCKQRGCGWSKIKALGYCAAHYSRLTRGQDMEAPVRRASSDEDRFWQKVRKSDTCWNWIAAQQNGYGVFRHEGAARLAHRISYMWHHGALSPEVELDHMCHNRSCVNPGHLRPATKVLNGQNRAGLNKNNTSGVRGVYWSSWYECWIAKGYINNTPKHIGYFDSLEDAAMAASEWRKKNMPYSITDQRKRAA